MNLLNYDFISKGPNNLVQLSLTLTLLLLSNMALLFVPTRYGLLPIIILIIVSAIMIMALLPSILYVYAFYKQLPLEIINIANFSEHMLNIERKINDANHSKSISLQDNLYLGTGFNWLPKHMRRFDEINRLRVFDLKQDDTSTGNEHIHRLEFKNNEALLCPTNILTGHSMIFGTTGTGKTSLLLLMILQAINRNEAVIVIDPKGDKKLKSSMRQLCANLKKSHKYTEFDRLDTQSDCLNPFSHFDDSTEIASRIGNLIPGGGASESFKQFSQSAVSIAVSYLKLKHMPITIRNIATSIGCQELFLMMLVDSLKTIYTEATKDDLQAYKDLDRYFKRICAMKDQEIEELWAEKFAATTSDTAKDLGAEAKANSHKSKSTAKIPTLANLKAFYEYMQEHKFINAQLDIDLLMHAASIDKGYYAKLSSSVVNILYNLCGDNLNTLLSSSEEHQANTLSRIIHTSSVAYIGLHCMHDSIVGSSLGKLFISDISAVAGMAYAKGKTLPRVNVFIDEASEVAIEALVQLLNKSRGANFAVTLASQSFADFVNRLNSTSSATQIMANCNNLFSLRCVDSQSAELIAKQFKETVRINHISTISTNLQLNQEQTLNRTISEHNSSMVSAAVINELPNLEFICKLANSKTFKGRLPFIEDNNHA